MCRRISLKDAKYNYVPISQDSKHKLLQFSFFCNLQLCAVAVQIRYFSVKTNKAKTFPLSSFYLPEKNVWAGGPSPGQRAGSQTLLISLSFPEQSL